LPIRPTDPRRSILEIMLRETLQKHNLQEERLNSFEPIFARLEDKLDLILKIGARILATLADLKAKVDAEGTVVNSAVTLINGISAELKAALAANDPAAVQAIADELDAQQAALAAAVANNPDPAASVTGAGTVGGATTSGAASA